MVEIQKSVMNDLQDQKTNNRKSISKSISSTLLPRALTPRNDRSSEYLPQTELSSSAGASPRLTSEDIPQIIIGKDEKRKSWKNQLTKRSSEINSKSLNPNNRTKSELQVPNISAMQNSTQTNRPNMSPTLRPKSDLQVPPLLTANLTTTQPCQESLSQRDTRKSKGRSVKSKGKENLN